MKRAVVMRALIALPALGLAVPLPVAADWTVSGSSTFRMDTYDVDGDQRYSPYSEEGTYVSNDLNLSLFGDTAPGQSWRVDFAGTLTDSPYRSQYSGLVPEVMRLSYDNTTAALPFRIDLGDQNVWFSELSLNRTLKAGRVTLRPESGTGGRSYWASAVVGSNGQQWRDLDPQADLYRGLSIGMQDQRLGTYGVNAVHHSREGLDGLPDLSQWVVSLTAQRQFDVAGQDLDVRGELAYFSGESAVTAYLPEDERTDSGYGYYLQMDGRSQSRPLDYRLRYDRYGSGFRPSGSSAPADSEAILAEGGWRFERGVQLRGRVQRTRTGVSSPDPVDTDSAAVSLEGPLFPDRPQRATARLDLSAQQRESASGDIDAVATTAKIGVAVNHSPRHQTRLNASVATVDDRHRPGTERVTRQFAAGHTAKLDLGGVDLSVTPGVSLTQVEAQEVEATLGPTLVVEAARDRERLVLELGRSGIDAADPVADVEQERLSLKVEIKRGRHSFGAAIDRTARQPAVGEDTEAWHAGMYWRYDLGNNPGDSG
jgi:hypothetical protein